MLAERSCPEPLRLHDTRREGLDQDVGAADEREELFATLRVVNIEDDASLAQAEGAPEKGCFGIAVPMILSRAGERRRESRLTASGWLDLDDFGSEVCENAARCFSKRCAEVEDPDAFERSRHAGRRSFSARTLSRRISCFVWSSNFESSAT